MFGGMGRRVCVIGEKELMTFRPEEREGEGRPTESIPLQTIMFIDVRCIKYRNNLERPILCS